MAAHRPASKPPAVGGGLRALSATGIASRLRRNELTNAADIGGGQPIRRPYTFTVPPSEYRSLPIPGLGGAKIGDSFVEVMALPEKFDNFMEVNPRVPKRTQKGILSGPVVKGIIETSTELPDDMAIKNQGIYLLVEDAEFSRATGGAGTLKVTLADPDRHGIVTAATPTPPLGTASKTPTR